MSPVAMQSLRTVAAASPAHVLLFTGPGVSDELRDELVAYLVFLGVEDVTITAEKYLESGQVIAMAPPPPLAWPVGGECVL
jgi:hypothetical protein